MAIKIDKSRFQIQWRDPASLTPNPLNHRRHPEAQRQVLRAALGDEGWIDPVIFNIRTGRVIDGHARVEEAIAAGASLGQAVEVPVLELDVDEATERRIIARHDRIGAMAEIDWTALAENLQGLGELGLGAAELGWEELSAAAIISGAAVPASQTLPENVYREQYGVIVICQSEREQEEVYGRLVSEGFACRVVTT